MSNVAYVEHGSENADADDLQKLKQEFCSMITRKLMLVGFPIHCPDFKSRSDQCIRMPAAMRLSMSSLRNAIKVLAVISPLSSPAHQGFTLGLN
jgi:hypothetical protein